MHAELNAFATADETSANARAKAHLGTSDHLAPGVFVCGRQHSGNTMLTALLGRIDGFVATLDEGVFFECRPTLEKLPDAMARAQWMSRHLDLKQPHAEQQISRELYAWAHAHPQADAIEVFQKAMALTVQTLGKHSWAGKATSYIFHAETILREMPNVRLIYLMRNPFDLCTSVKRRNLRWERLVGPSLSWSRGAGLALRLAEHYPDQVQVIRYEKLVSEPEVKIRRLCAFLGVPYDPSLLNTPRINTSDRPYQLEAQASGVTDAHVYYYTSHLSDPEILAMQTLCSRRLLQRLYPDLPHASRRFSTLSRLQSVGLIAAGLVRYPIQVLTHARRYGFPIRQYVTRRLSVLVRGREPRG